MAINLVKGQRVDIGQLIGTQRQRQLINVLGAARGNDHAEVTSVISERPTSRGGRGGGRHLDS